MLRSLNSILWPQQPLNGDMVWLDLGFILITPGCRQADLKTGGLAGLVIPAEMVGTDLGNSQNAKSTKLVICLRQKVQDSRHQIFLRCLSPVRIKRAGGGVVTRSPGDEISFRRPTFTVLAHLHMKVKTLKHIRMGLRQSTGLEILGSTS